MTGCPRLGLALGGGSARGLAHVGVLETLDRAGIKVDCLAGTSAGSLVGAAYAAGVRGQRLAEMGQRMRWRHIARPAWPRRGLVSFDRLEAYLVRELGDRTFASLELPYAAVATDLLTGEAVVLREGRLAPAVHASCAVPGIVVPVEMNGRLLVDGAVANNLPISVVRSLGAEVVIAVGLGAPDGQPPRGSLPTLVAAMDLLLMRAADPPQSADVYLSIPVWGPGSLVHLSRWQELVELGRRAAESALPAIHAACATGGQARGFDL